LRSVTFLLSLYLSDTVLSMTRLPPTAAHVRAYVRLRSVDPMRNRNRNRDRSYTLTWQRALISDGALTRC